MEDTPVVAQTALSPEDMQRVNSCDFYQKAKEIIQSAEDYRDFEVGSAIHITRKYDNKMISSDYDSKVPDKFIIVHNDNGFLFVKKVLASGKPGVTVTCVTIEYPSCNYSLKVDDGYIESMLLDTQDQYDPLADAKSMVKKKGKASRENAKKRLMYDTSAEALAFLKNLAVGSKIWRSDYSYGGDITEYEVTQIDTRPPAAASGSGWNRTYGDTRYINAGLKEVVVVHLNPLHSTSRYTSSTTLEFYSISKADGGGYYHYYASKPLTPHDIV